ncbi:unnamed protein product [Cuscuta epithymum]|uniref:Uncharacterized protein n=1 Tax=Cuscuta epithymum TaxID=186058 RepID=A0AAV0FZ74_9ASTE|nr:unnamed protein product [Cuscuta epithymum]
MIVFSNILLVVSGRQFQGRLLLISLLPVRLLKKKAWPSFEIDFWPEESALLLRSFDLPGRRKVTVGEGGLAELDADFRRGGATDRFLARVICSGLLLVMSGGSRLGRGLLVPIAGEGDDVTGAACRAVCC